MGGVHRCRHRVIAIVIVIVIAIAIVINFCHLSGLASYHGAKWRGQAMRIEVAKPSRLEKLKAERELRDLAAVKAAENASSKAPSINYKSKALHARDMSLITSKNCKLRPNWRKVRYGRPVRLVRMRFPGKPKAVVVDPLELDEKNYRRVRVEENRIEDMSVRGLRWRYAEDDEEDDVVEEMEMETESCMSDADDCVVDVPRSLVDENQASEDTKTNSPTEGPTAAPILPPAASTTQRVVSPLIIPSGPLSFIDKLRMKEQALAAREEEPVVSMLTGNVLPVTCVRADDDGVQIHSAGSISEDQMTTENPSPEPSTDNRFQVKTDLKKLFFGDHTSAQDSVYGMELSFGSDQEEQAVDVEQPAATLTPLPIVQTPAAPFTLSFEDADFGDLPPVSVPASVPSATVTATVPPTRHVTNGAISAPQDDIFLADRLKDPKLPFFFPHNQPTPTVASQPHRSIIHGTHRPSFLRIDTLERVIEKWTATRRQFTHDFKKRNRFALKHRNKAQRGPSQGGSGAGGKRKSGVTSAA